MQVDRHKSVTGVMLFTKKGNTELPTALLLSVQLQQYVVTYQHYYNHRL